MCHFGTPPPRTQIQHGREGLGSDSRGEGHWSESDEGPEAQAAVQESGEDGQIQREFHYRDKKRFTRLYVQYVRPHVEFAAPESRG